MAKKVYTVGNYLYIDDLITGERISGSRSAFEFVVKSITDLYFTVLKDKQAVDTVKVGDMLDENSVLYTMQTFQTFKEASSGFNPAPGSGAYTQEQIDKATRMTLTPYKLVTYLPVESPYTSPSILAGVPTKMLLPTVVKSINNFALVDIGGGNMSYQFQGADPAIFTVLLETGVRSGTNNVSMILQVYVNGVYSLGLSTNRKIANLDLGNLTLLGEVSLEPLDTIAIYVETDLTSTITFSRTSIQVVERN
jgi:hypothetical protein